MPAEAVRLVVWDLDETFWRGTLSEGGITQYLSRNHDAVVTLAARGIVSSICSKNDFDAVKQVLVDSGIWDYFVMPSISWEPKGPRVQALVEAFGLRAPTVLFVDDNPGNRGEVAATTPGIQVADETFLERMLTDPLMQGKSDPGLTRLAQYKVVEKKRLDEVSSGADNVEFLRNSNIVVEFDYDVERNIDRAVELIARTNQLNYTKNRLPDDPDKARAVLLKQIGEFWRRSALVKVRDKYGDYGYCGFFVCGIGANANLEHFCFSCRTLGMQVERWVYDQLGRPGLKVVGEVLTDLSAPQAVDWINFASAAEGVDAKQKEIPEVRLRGGCELDALSHYFVPVANVVRRETSFRREPFFIAKNGSHLLFTDDRSFDPDYLALAQDCGYESEDFRSELFGPSESNTLMILSTWSDISRCTYRHRDSGELLTVGAMPIDDLQLSEDEYRERLKKGQLSEEAQGSLLAAFRALKSRTEPVIHREESEVKQHLSLMFESVPAGCRVAVLGVDETAKQRPGIKGPLDQALEYNIWLESVAASYGAKMFRVGDYVLDPSERQYTGHFHRIVYARLATAISDWAIEAARREAEGPRLAPSAGKDHLAVFKGAAKALASALGSV